MKKQFLFLLLLALTIFVPASLVAQISFDAASEGTRSDAATSISWSHTITGPNPFIMVMAMGGVSVDNVTGVTVGGTPMTFLDKYHLPGDRWVYAYYLFNPPTGSQSIVISGSTTEFLMGASASYKGIASTALDNSFTSSDNTGTTYNINNTITTVSNNCWHMVIYAATNGRPTIAGSGTTKRFGNNGQENFFGGDNNAAITPAGTSHTVNVISDAAHTNSKMVAFGMTVSPTAPPVAPTVTTPTVTSISSGGATLGANITANGGASITSRGTCWGTSANPTTNCVADGSTSTGVFTQARTGMPSGTLIYYRGYAINSVGTGYSSDGNFLTISATAPTVRVLAVGGGGGGGFNTGGGGGGGGYQYDASHVIAVQAYSVTVGAGGTGGTPSVPAATNGSNSVFNTIIAIGGGAGGSGSNPQAGSNGGSGGGGAQSTAAGGTGSQGNNGGSGAQSPSTIYLGGGGGGAGATGGNANTGTATAGSGGAGIANTISGSSVTYAGGGGGGAYNASSIAGTGGAGGGGNGATGILYQSGSSGTANTGGGGGGNAGTSGSGTGTGGNGGSGIVIISYPTGLLTASGGAISTSGGNTIHTFTSNGIFTVGAIATAPTVTSPAITSVTSTTATLGANVTSNGGASITARGTCWGTSANPTTNCVAEGGTATGTFTQARTGLTTGTLLYYRAYATNAAGTGYSADGTFTPSTSASAAVDWNNSNVQEIILTANRSLTFSNGKSGATYSLVVKQNGTGGWTVAWPANVKWNGGTAPSPGTGANAATLLKFIYDGTDYLENGISQY